MYRSIATDVGLEIEAADVPVWLVEKLLVDRGVKYGDVKEDGSIREILPSVFGLPHIKVDADSENILRTLGAYKESARMGAEVISPIISTTNPEWERYIFDTLEVLLDLGEGVATSTGIHVHVNAKGLPIDAIHNMIRLWQSVEAGIYRISSGPLGKYRGSSHMDSHFCRPLVPDGALVCDCEDGRKRQTFDVNSLLATVDMREFAQALGRTDVAGAERRHYHPSRYAGICFYSLFRQGSIELRTFNTTDKASHIIAWVELAKAIIRVSMNKNLPEELETHPYGSKDMLFNQLISYLQMRRSDVIYTLEDLWNMGDFPPPLKGKRMNHLGYYIDWSGVDSILIPKTIEDEKVYPHDSLKNKKRVGEVEGHISIKMLNKLLNMYRR